MKDRFGREIEYVRISVTQNCNLKCIYCSPEEDSPISECSTALSPAEFEEIVRILVRAGVRKVRITGGEPLTRTDICEIIERIARIPGVEDLSMTTNGIHLDRMIEKLKVAGLQRLNISLDSLQKEKFAYITGGGRLEDTVKGIEKALELGLHPVKINTVLMKGVNDDEVDAFIQMTKDKPLEVRLIELMPIGQFGEENTDKIVYNSEIIKNRPELIPCEEGRSNQPAKYYRIPGHQGKIGFISPLSHQFCDKCNRIRLTCDGKVKPCLGDNGETNIMRVLRQYPDQLSTLIEKIIYLKPKGHNFANGFSSKRGMNRIGG